MEKDNSQKKYRGFKYVILAALFFGAVGIFLYSTKGQFQRVNPQAEVKESAESMVAGVKQQGKDLMEKAGEMKSGISDTMTKSRDKVSEISSSLSDKADQMAESATQTGTQWVDKAKSMVTDSDKTMADAAQSNAMSGEVSNAKETLTGGLSGDQGQMDTQSDGASVEDKMAQSGSETLTTGTSGTKTMGASSSSKTSTTASNATAQKDTTPGSARQCKIGQDFGTKYVVAYCETLSNISKRTGVGLNDLIDQNPEVVNPNLIYPNQELRMPTRG